MRNQNGKMLILQWMCILLLIWFTTYLFNEFKNSDSSWKKSFFIFPLVIVVALFIYTSYGTYYFYKKSYSSITINKEGKKIMEEFLSTPSQPVSNMGDNMMSGFCSFNNLNSGTYF
jgi:hypothetical protein